MSLTTWWRPQGSSRVEDLLKPGTDTEKDLGIALLALHRAGAEACELVAKTAIADEHVLVTALAETRALLAPVAVEVISKSVGGSSYAGLLLRDVLDDAEVGALALYRTCLSKNVAPPIAAQRVGMVYGVNSRSMSKYASVASDPKANPQAVQDLADRTLFDFVSKVVADEHEPEKELVSKAPGDYLDEHNVTNGPGGRFVAEKEGAEASLESLFAQTQKRPEAAPKEVAPPPRPSRNLRSLRQTRSLRQVKPAQQTEPQGGQSLGGQSLGGGKLGGSLKGALLNSLGGSLNAAGMRGQELTYITPMPLSGNPRAVPSLWRRRGNPVGEETIGESASFILEDSEYIRLAGAAGDLGGAHVMRVGGLSEYAGKPRRYQKKGERQATDEHAAGVEHVMDMIATRDQHDTQNAIETTEILITPGMTEKELTDAKVDWLIRKANTTAKGINVASEVANVAHAPHIDRPDRMVLAWRPPRRDEVGRLTPAARVPRIVEMVIAPDTAKGRQVSNKIEFNPDQVIAMQSLFGSREVGDTRVVWDPKVGAIRALVVAAGVDEGAMEAARWREKKSDYLDEHNVTHGPGGRFVAERDGQEATLEELFARTQQRPPAEERHMAQPRQVRRLATLRGQRSLKPVETKPTTGGAKLGGSLGGTLGSKLSSKLEGKLTAGLEQQILVRRDAPKDASLFELDPNSTYAALSPGAVDWLLRKGEVKGFVGEGVEIPVEGNARSFVAEHVRDLGSPHDADLMIQAITEWQRQKKIKAEAEGWRTNDPRLERQVINETVEDFGEQIEVYAKVLNSMVSANASMQMFNVEITVSPTNNRTRLRVTTNTEVMPEVHSVRLPEGMEAGEVRSLKEGGVYRLHNAWTIDHMLRWVYDQAKSHGGAATETIAHPHVRTWHAEP